MQNKNKKKYSGDAPIDIPNRFLCWCTEAQHVGGVRGNWRKGDMYSTSDRAATETPIDHWAHIILPYSNWTPWHHSQVNLTIFSYFTQLFWLGRGGGWGWEAGPMLGREWRSQPGRNRHLQWPCVTSVSDPTGRSSLRWDSQVGQGHESGIPGVGWQIKIKDT